MNEETELGSTSRCEHSSKDLKHFLWSIFGNWSDDYSNEIELWQCLRCKELLDRYEMRDIRAREDV